MGAGQGWGTDRPGTVSAWETLGGVGRTWTPRCLLRRGVSAKDGAHVGSDGVLRSLPATAGGGTGPSARPAGGDAPSLGTPVIGGGFPEESAGTWAAGRWFLVRRLHLVSRGLEEPRGWGLMSGEPPPPSQRSSGHECGAQPLCRKTRPCWFPLGQKLLVTQGPVFYTLVLGQILQFRWAPSGPRPPGVGSLQCPPCVSDLGPAPWQTSRGARSGCCQPWPHSVGTWRSFKNCSARVPQRVYFKGFGVCLRLPE